MKITINLKQRKNSTKQYVSKPMFERWMQYNTKQHALLQDCKQRDDTRIQCT